MIVLTRMREILAAPSPIGLEAAMTEGVFIELETRTNQGINRTVKYPMNNTGKAAQWLAANPSRMDLGQLSFVHLGDHETGDESAGLLQSDITQVSQRRCGTDLAP